MTTLTRRYRFSASHRLNCSDLSPAENQRLFGKCNNPYGHGHDYVLAVSVSGPVNATTGQLLRIEDLDGLVEEHVLRKLSFRYLNLDVPPFSQLVPTTENVVLVIRNILLAHWREYFGSTECQLWKVSVRETDRNLFEMNVGTRDRSKARVSDQEEMSVDA